MTNSESQNRTSTKKRTASQLRAALDKVVTAYAVAASAAGVSLLALVQPAEGKIIYTGAGSEIAPKVVLPLDLNHGGHSDFSFSNQLLTCSGCHTFSDNLTIAPIGQNGIMSHAAVLPAGAQVGPKGAFQNSAQLMLGFREHCSSTCGYGTGGAWKNITQGYLGLKFYVNGQAHYGWARLNVTLTQGGRAHVYALLTGYAYETVPNKPIITGRRRGPGAMSGPAGLSHEPDRATLGALAKGAAGLAIWRRASAPGE